MFHYLIKLFINYKLIVIWDTCPARVSTWNRKWDINIPRSIAAANETNAYMRKKCKFTFSDL